MIQRIPPHSLEPAQASGSSGRGHGKGRESRQAVFLSAFPLSCSASCGALGGYGAITFWDVHQPLKLLRDFLPHPQPTASYVLQHGEAAAEIGVEGGNSAPAACYKDLQLEMLKGSS